VEKGKGHAVKLRVALIVILCTSLLAIQSISFYSAWTKHINLIGYFIAFYLYGISISLVVSGAIKVIREFKECDQPPQKKSADVYELRKYLT